MQLIMYQIRGATTSAEIVSDEMTKKVKVVTETSAIPVEIAQAADELFAHLCRRYQLNAWDFQIKKTEHTQLGIQFHFSYTHLINDIQEASTTITNIPNLDEMNRCWKYLQNQVAEHYQGMLKMTDRQLALAL